MSSMWWRRKPTKWHRSNKIRGYVPSSGGFSARTRHTGLPKQSHMQTFRPGKRTNMGGYPRTTGMYRNRFNRIYAVSRGLHSTGLSKRPIAMGRGSGPYMGLIALGVGSGGKTQSLLRRNTAATMRYGAASIPKSHRISRRSMYALGGAAAIGAGGYAIHRRRRTKRNYKGQFAGSY